MTPEESVGRYTICQPFAKFDEHDDGVANHLRFDFKYCMCNEISGKNIKTVRFRKIGSGGARMWVIRPLAANRNEVPVVCI